MYAWYKPGYARVYEFLINKLNANCLLAVIYMSIYVCVYVYVCIRVYMSIYVCKYVYVCIHVYMCISSVFICGIRLAIPKLLSPYSKIFTSNAIIYLALWNTKTWQRLHLMLKTTYSVCWPLKRKLVDYRI